jgi:hypothetical protein
MVASMADEKYWVFRIPDAPPQVCQQLTSSVVAVSVAVVDSCMSENYAMVSVQSPGVHPSSENLNGLYYCWKPGAPLRNLQVVFEARMHGQHYLLHKSFVKVSHRLLDNFDQPWLCNGSMNELV